MAQMFNKPNFIKPEINELIYYVHLAILAIVVLAILQYFQGGEMLTIKNVLYSIPLLLLGDIIAHTLLRLN